MDKHIRVFKECADGRYHVDSHTWKHMMKARHGTNVWTPVQNRLVTSAEADKLIAYWQSKGYTAIKVHRG